MISSDDVQVMLTIDEPCECGATDQDQNPVRKGDCCQRGWSKVGRSTSLLSTPYKISLTNIEPLVYR